MTTSEKLEALAVAAEAERQARAMLDAARETRRGALLAAWQEGWTWRQLAETAQVTQFTVQSDLRRAGAELGGSERQEARDEARRQSEADRRANA